MKLLFVIKTLKVPGGGAERVLAMVSGALAARGHDVTIASFDARPGEPFYQLDPKVRFIALDAGDVRRRTKTEELIARVRRLRATALELRPDAAIGFMHSAYVPLGFALLGARIRTFGSEHIVFEHYAHKPFERLMLKLVAPALSGITAVSEQMRQSFPPVLRARMQVVANPVMRPSTVAKPRRKARKILLTAGRLDPQKNQEILVSAFARLAEDYPDWTLRILGEGSLRRALERQVADLGLADRVELPGVIADIDREYEKAELFAIPSRYESQGLATAEAMSHGLPAVGFADCPGVNELIDDGINGILVAGEDKSKRLADALARLMDSADERQRMGEQARQGSARFDVDTIAADWEEFLNPA